jgi:hypothetical protein
MGVSVWRVPPQALPLWAGTDALTGREHVRGMASKLQQLVQPGVLRQQPAELLQVLKEVEVAPAAHMRAKMKSSSYYHRWAPWGEGWIFSGLMLYQQ